MALIMARPFKDPKSGMWLFRQRTPRDLLVSLRGSTVTLPISEQQVAVKVGDLVQASLRTKDNAIAKARYVAADATLKAFWVSHRTGPIRLLQAQVVALSADKYHAFMRAFSSEPGTPEQWAQFKAIIEDARKRRIDPDDDGPDFARQEAMEKRFGRSADEILADKKLLIDADSRSRLLDAIATAQLDAADALIRRAEGDYSEDAKAARFPAWSPVESPHPVPASHPGPDLSPQKLFDLWSAKHQDRLAPATIRRYRASWQSLIAFFGKREVSTLTSDDIYAWAEHRRDAEGASPGSINKNDLVAASSVFKWGMDRDSGRLLTSNPVTGVRLIEPRKVLKRERTFREDEVKMLLGLASHVQIDPDNPTLSHAQRWCQWLAAYSGARIAETTGLTGADITIEEGVHVMHFRKTKTGIPRTVPLHDHLIEQGFLDFVRSRGQGPLFYDPGRHSTKATTNPADQRAIKLAAWVRKETSLDMDVDPNHGWRHTWKTRALGAGIDERLRDAIAGHGPGNVARSYETPTIGMLAAAIKKFPRYPAS